METISKILRVGAIMMGVVSLILSLILLLDKEEIPVVEYVPGAYVPGGYVSHFLGYEYTTPKDCILGAIEDRASASKVSTKGLDSYEIEQALKTSKAPVDLTVVMPSTGSGIVVTFVSENGKPSATLEEGAEQVKAALTNFGSASVTLEKEAEFLGRECAMYDVEMVYRNRRMEMDAYTFVENGYMWMVWVVYEKGNEEDAELLLSGFTPYN